MVQATFLRVQKVLHKNEKNYNPIPTAPILILLKGASWNTSIVPIAPVGCRSGAMAVEIACTASTVISSTIEIPRLVWQSFWLKTTKSCWFGGWARTKACGAFPAVTWSMMRRSVRLPGANSSPLILCRSPWPFQRICWFARSSSAVWRHRICQHGWNHVWRRIEHDVGLFPVTGRGAVLQLNVEGDRRKNP